MVTDGMLQNAAAEAENALLAAVETEGGEVHEFSEGFEKRFQKLIERVRNPFRYHFKRIAPITAGVLIAAICAAIFLSPKFGKYKRISFDSGEMGDVSYHMNENTVVVNHTKADFPNELPIYEITPRNITQKEFEAMKEALNLPEDNGSDIDLELNGNRTFYNGAYYTDTSRGYFDMTDEELEAAAWEVFRKIPFLEGEYKYMGIKGTHILSDSEGDHIVRAGVRFQLMLDGCRVAGDHSVMLYFDGSGLVEIVIRMYEYKKIGTMEVVPLEEAEARIKTPDDFTFEASGMIQTLQVEQVQLLYSSQYSRGCTILQPIYVFSGTALMEEEREEEFSLTVIAIPEKYTYE